MNRFFTLRLAFLLSTAIAVVALARCSGPEASPPDASSDAADDDLGDVVPGCDAGNSTDAAPAVSVDLFAQLASASIVNDVGTALPDYSTDAGTNYSTGGYGDISSSETFADGSHTSGHGFFLLPPNNPADTLHATFPSEALTAASAYAFVAKVGIRAATGSTATGVHVQLVASADAAFAGDATSAVLWSATVTRTDTLNVNVGLGVWPMRPHFHVTLTAEAAGANNYYDAVMFDSPSIAPVRARPGLGVCDSNLVWAKGGLTEIDQRMDEMAAIGARQLRTAARGTSVIAAFVEIVRKAREHGIRVLMNVLPDDSDYDDPSTAKAYTSGDAGAAFAAICGYQGAHRLSTINPSKFGARIQAYLSALASSGLAVDAIEVGNENDWVCFNGDIPLSGAMPAPDLDATTTAFARMLEAASKTARASSSCQAPAIVTGGFANALVFRSPNNGAIDPIAFLSKLQSGLGQNYLVAYADAVGEHVYISEAQTRTTLAAHAAAIRASRPMWVTEFGVSLSNQSTALARYDAFTADLALFGDIGGVDVAAAYLYAFDDGPWAVFDDATNTALPESQLFVDYPLP